MDTIEQSGEPRWFDSSPVAIEFEDASDVRINLLADGVVFGHIWCRGRAVAGDDADHCWFLDGVAEDVIAALVERTQLNLSLPYAPSAGWSTAASAKLDLRDLFDSIRSPMDIRVAVQQVLGTIEYSRKRQSVAEEMEAGLLSRLKRKHDVQVLTDVAAKRGRVLVDNLHVGDLAFVGWSYLENEYLWSANDWLQAYAPSAFPNRLDGGRSSWSADTIRRRILDHLCREQSNPAGKLR